MDQIKIGKFIAELRKNKNMTQEQLGEKLGVSFKTISKWENGRGMPELSTLKLLSEELGVSINEILSGEKLSNQNYQEKLEENIVNTLDYSHKKIKSIKYILIVFAALIIFILLTMFVLFGIDVTRMRNNEPVFFSTWGFKYAPPINIDDAIMENTIKDYLIKEDEKTNHYNNEKSFVAMRTYLIEEESKEKYYIYAWVLQEKYYLENQKIVRDTASSIPHKFELSKNGDVFVVEDYEIPRDGSYYDRDMKSIFPNSVLRDINHVDTDGTIEKLSLEIKREIDLYFHEVDNDIKDEESEIEMDLNMSVIINEETYHAILEENETAKSFLEMLPQEYDMKELNGNEKYIYLDNTLPTNSSNPEHIEKGDMMLYGDNCIVVFYKFFDTSYSYTKIGHIENLPDLGNTDITIRFEK